MSKKIAVATGSRADWGLLLPLVKELDRRDCELIVIATYSHLFKEMGDTIKELVSDGFAPKASIPAGMQPPQAVADTVTGFSRAFKFLKPDVVVILGDRFEMLGVATAALLNRIPIAHIAGGTVSEGAFDDSIRNAISQMAELHFPETDRGRDRLISMGAKPENVITSGALGVFNSLNTPLMSLEEIEESINFKLGDKFLLGTYHPATLDEMAPDEQMRIWIKGLEQAIEKDPDLKLLLTYPNSDTDPGALLLKMYDFEMKNPKRVKIVESLGRVRYLSAARLAKVVAGNSSSGIVEVPSLGTTVIDVGNRQKGRERSRDVEHVNLDTDEIAEKIIETVNNKNLKADSPNPYFKENTPSIIADKILGENSENKEQANPHPEVKPFFLIPARGGSKGVPGKNIRNLNGKPLICHSIEHGLKIGNSEDVIVSTDSEEIAEIAKEAGANVPFLRPAELATDTAGSRGVILHAADFLKTAGKDYNTVVLLQPTSPLRNPEDIRRALEKYKATGADMVVSVNEAKSNPYFNLFEEDGEGMLHPSKGNGTVYRRQDAPKVWEYNGSIYVINIEALRDHELSQLEKIIPLPVEDATGIDIDTEEDFRKAESLMRNS